MKTITGKILTGISCAALACVAATAAAAQNGGGASMSASLESTAETMTYWTAERLKSAKPKILTTTRTFTPSAATAAPTGPTKVVPGAPPSIAYDGSLAQQIYAPGANNSEVQPALVGTGKYPYTIQRLYPTSGSTTSNIFNFYPYEIVGQLFFTEPSGNFVCSASVIRLSTIATAGHCVSDGNGHFYKNWLFIPAWHAGVAPFGKWNWSYVNVTGPWFHGGGTVPNSQDDALIVLGLNSGKKIGQLTGYLGFEYNAALPTHLTQLGYPCNLDSCSDPVRDDSQVFSGPNNNFEWGTDAFGGASGGPEIQDFGQKPTGAPSEILGGNILISSTSYTYSTATQVDGGSILKAPTTGTLQSFGDLINDVCAHHSGC